MINRKYYILIILCCFTSCEKDFLNVVPDNIATIDLAFNNRATAERFLSTCYTYIPEHAHIEQNVIIGGNSAVQQFTRVGKFAMIGGMCGVVRDIIPYAMVHGNRSVLKGLNLIGLRRKNIPNKEILVLSEAYKEIFKNENLTENLKNLNAEIKKNGLVKDVIEFLEKDKKRPICTPFSK